MDATADRFDFAPPHGRRWRGPLGLALFVHGLLIIALTWGISWNENPQVVAEAELWSALPKVAAPRANEPDEPPPPPVAKTAPPQETEATPPPPVAPQRSQADIALEKKKKEAEQKRREDELQRQAEAKKQAERKKQDELKKQREAEQAKQKEREKAAQEKAAKEKAAKDKTLAEQKKKDDAQRKAEDARRDAQLEADRKKNLERMMGLAGASGGSTAQGKDLQSSGPSASYAGKVVARIKPNIVFTDTAPGNPRAEVEVRTLPDGTLLPPKLLKSSGNSAWDDAVLRAIVRTATLPKDENGKVPGTLVLVFRPLD
ncbi:MAG TPA: cell envelope integrity protein TolA [Macromonas sp.]|nr:cell envelope integrity protein TolA [Macromonas sp.]